MLIGIPSVVGPDLLALLHRMGHGDELVLGDAFFTGETLNPRVLRADGVKIADLLDGILTLMNLDSYDPAPVIMMQPAEGDVLDQDLETAYRSAIDRHWPQTPAILRLERFAFYERAKKGFAVLITGETTKYGNIILKKGVIPVFKK